MGGRDTIDPSSLSSQTKSGPSRLFQKKFVFDRYKNLQLVRGVPGGAARSELLDLSGAEMRCKLMAHTIIQVQEKKSFKLRENDNLYFHSPIRFVL